VLVKNSDYSGQITDQGKKGEGIVWRDGFPVYIPNGIPGDQVEFKVLKVDKRRAFGKLLRVIVPSSDRVEPKCSVALQCGGCQLQHQSQVSQVRFKSNVLVSRLSRFVDLSNVLVQPMVSADRQWATRNKMQFAFGMGNDGLKIGLYAPRSHRVVNMDYCEIMSASMNQVLAAIRAWHAVAQVSVFNELTGEGVLRHVSVRHSYVTGELMVILTVGEGFDYSGVVAAIQGVDGVCSMYVSIQSDPSDDRVLGDHLDLVWGCSTIRDVVCGTTCYVSPKTFMQANAMLVNRLYQILMKSLNVQGALVDLYCGAGVLTCSLARHYDQVIGVDNNESAIGDAQRNAKENGLNVEFVCQDAGDFLRAYSDEDMTIIVDPPRQGLAIVPELLQKKPSQIVYVSCYPDTLGRDLRGFVEGGYRISSIQGVDMFCHTPHIECVVVLEFLGGSE
tara:strand:- start:296 stop:1633 length:1338 start_codon:yes stop_codon:yes gene_type:complete